jgi:AcrR family transcriptional regulator
MTENVRLTIGDVVAETGVPATTIHHYRRFGLLPPSASAAADHFVYDQSHVRAIKLVRLLRDQRRLPLRSIAEILPDLLESGDDVCMDIDRYDTALAARGAPGDDVRERLLDAAIEEFGARGYAEVSVGDIAERAAVSKGSVYRHFASKTDLFFESIDRAVTLMLERFDDAARDYDGSIDAKLAAVLLTEPVRPVLSLLFELGARSLQGHPGHLEEARTVLQRLIDGAGAPVQDDMAIRERGAAVLQTLIIESFRAILPPAP